VTEKKKKAKQPLELPRGWGLVKQVKGKDGVVHLRRSMGFVVGTRGQFFLNVHVHECGGVLISSGLGEPPEYPLYGIPSDAADCRKEVEQIGKLFYGDNWKIGN